MIYERENVTTRIDIQSENIHSLGVSGYKRRSGIKEVEIAELRLSMPNLSYHVINYDPKDGIDDIDSRICSPKQKFATMPITCGVKWKTYHYTGCKFLKDINLVFQHQIWCHPNGHRRREHLLHFLRVKPRVPASKKKKRRKKKKLFQLEYLGIHSNHTCLWKNPPRMPRWDRILHGW